MKQITKGQTVLRYLVRAVLPARMPQPLLENNGITRPHLQRGGNVVSRGEFCFFQAVQG